MISGGNVLHLVGPQLSTETHTKTKKRTDNKHGNKGAVQVKDEKRQKHRDILGDKRKHHNSLVVQRIQGKLRGMRHTLINEKHDHHVIKVLSTATFLFRCKPFLELGQQLVQQFIMRYHELHIMHE
jgi:hypothetical protein